MKRVLDPLWGGWFGVPQGVGDAKLVPFEDAKRVIGQNLDALDIVQCLDEVAGALEVGIYVRDVRDEDMANPDRDLVVGEPPQCFKDVLVAVARELLVLDRVDVP